MENKNIILLKHHPMNVFYTNPFYTNQTENNLEDYTIIDVTSRIERNKEFMAEHPNFAKELSPFFVGPVVSSDGVTANVLEIFWQCGKVYPCHDDHGKPNAAYFEWRNYYYSQKECTKDLMRHACKSLGFDHRDTRYFAYYDKEKKEYLALNYVEARKKVYFPEYAKLVANTESFLWLKSIVDSGKKLALVDFDAYNYYETCAKRKMYEAYLNRCKKEKNIPVYSENDFQIIYCIKDLINCSFMGAGHACVLKALLQGDIEVSDGNVIDKSGILI